MNVYDAVRTVLATRQFKPDPIPDDVVRKIAEAAHLTASAGNKQPWHFVVVRDRDALRKLGELAKTGPYIAQAPLAIAVAVEPGAIGVSDGSRAIQDMILTAWAEGVGSNWVGFRGLEDAAKFLGLPDDLELLGIVPFGYPAHESHQGKKNRKPIGDVVSSERYGQPWA
jgi:nitroreductase